MILTFLMAAVKVQFDWSVYLPLIEFNKIRTASFQFLSN